MKLENHMPKPSEIMVCYERVYSHNKEKTYLQKPTLLNVLTFIYLRPATRLYTPDNPKQHMFDTQTFLATYCFSLK